ncbi:hypothetical protein [Lentzea sp. NPDC004782]
MNGTSGRPRVPDLPDVFAQVWHAAGGACAAALPSTGTSRRGPTCRTP